MTFADWLKIVLYLITYGWQPVYANYEFVANITKSEERGEEIVSIG
jgi:hypothetical protein